MRNLFRFVLVSSLFAGAIGCSAESADQAARDARDNAAEARDVAADANARVAAADARVEAADARVGAADADVVAAKADAVADDRIADPAPRPSVSKTVIPSGTVLKVSLIDSLGSDTSAAGDRFLASLSESVVVNGVTVLQKGTQLRGRVIEAEDSGRVKGRASISLALTEIMQGNKMVGITTDTHAAVADSTQNRDAGIIAGGAGVGAIIGAVTGGKKGAAIGAATGGGAGTGVVLATKGKEIHYAPETRMNFTLSNPSGSISIQP